MVMDAVGSAASAVGEAIGLIKPKKALLKVVSDIKPKHPDDIVCMFNPTEYSLTQTAKVTFTNAPNKPGPTAEYGGANALKLGVTLFFDEYELANGDITPKITRLLSWTLPMEKTRGPGGKPTSPLVAFIWGNAQIENFCGYLTSVDVKYKLFSRSGKPLRADVTIALEGANPDYELTNPTSHATDTTQTHTLVEGETLQAVAYIELGKPAFWRAIADMNGIDDPLRVAPGSVLLIPTSADAAKNS
jgi:Contractile injection system tube protein/LysM domain